MPKQRTRRTARKNAIRNALDQLGWHAKGRDVVAFLANFGIEVHEGTVSSVKIENTKRSGEVKRLEDKLKSTDKRLKRPMLRKVPQQREYRR